MVSAMSSALPSWTRELIDLYESGAMSQFILHGNIGDRLVVASSQSCHLGSLDDFLKEVLLAKFDVVLGYDIGNGLRVEKGGDAFAQWPAMKGKALPTTPREAIQVLTHYLRFNANLAQLKSGNASRVAVIVRGVDLIAPPSLGAVNYELAAMAWQLREWGTDSAIRQHHCASFLLAENLNDIHPLLSANPQTARISIPLPQAADLELALPLLQKSYSTPLRPYEARLAEPAAVLSGATLHSVETLLKLHEHRHQELSPAALVAVKKELVERDALGLIEFVRPDRTLDDLYGQDSIKKWLRQDIDLWKQDDLAALPMGYLFCGPVGTGKTFLVECLAGEAGVPVVKMKNFRDKWVGSTESNLEKIFRLLAALGRCIVFVDEADQALGQRNAGAGDSGVSGRVYGMIAEQMSNSRNRGRIIWALATSRPDLVEVDLKRPGRVDVKIPIFPSGTSEEGYSLLRALTKRRGLDLPAKLPAGLAASFPDLLTPGAAEALSVKVYRSLKTGSASPEAALADGLDDYQPPVRLEILKAQIDLAVAEASDLSFVPERFRRPA